MSGIMIIVVIRLIVYKGDAVNFTLKKINFRINYYSET